MSGGGNEGLWVRSDVLPTGAYGVSINVGDDHAWTLPPDRALRYAAACVRRATEAEHDTAVLSFLGSIGADDEAAQALLTNDLWPDRVVNHEDTEPLRFHSGIGRRPSTAAFVPTLRMEVRGTEVGELTPADLRNHAVGVLNALAAADLDAAVVRSLSSSAGEDRARAMVESLTEHWPAEEKPRSNL